MGWRDEHVQLLSVRPAKSHSSPSGSSSSSGSASSSPHAGASTSTLAAINAHHDLRLQDDSNPFRIAVCPSVFPNREYAAKITRLLSRQHCDAAARPRPSTEV
jgi:hypothetical protein